MAERERLICGRQFGTITDRSLPIFALRPSRDPPFTAIIGKPSEGVGRTSKIDNRFHPVVAFSASSLVAIIST
ncbi:MAG: hypothetical protein ACLPX1_14670 [Steroidobacteraceae bacterium]